MPKWLLTQVLGVGFAAACCFPAGADTVVLKSGKTVSGKILEETPEYIRIEQGENPIYYQRSYISDIIRDGAQEDFSSADTMGVDTVREQSGGETEEIAVTAEAASIQDYLAVGLRLASEGKWTAAEETFRQGEVHNPYDPNILGALDLLDAIQSGRTDNECGLAIFRGTYALMREDYADAVANLERARDMDPSQPDVSYNLGVAFYSMGEFQKALQALEQVLRIKPDDAPTYVLIANIYQLLGEKEKAQEHFYIAQTLFDRAGADAGMEYDSRSK